LAISLGLNPKSDVIDANASRRSKERESKAEPQKENLSTCDDWLCFAFYLQVAHNFIITIIAKKIGHIFVVHMEIHIKFLHVVNDICVALKCS
jgi:hypothetical protein